MIVDVIQRTDAWLECRLGIPTSSNFDKIVTTKGEPSKQAQKYLYKLAGERVSGICEESYQNGAMSHGVELEPEARNFYQVITDNEVEQVGFCISDDGFRYGASPDGLVGDNGLIEIKCPSIAVHVEYLLNEKLPTTYFQQVQGQLLVTSREWCDFISYFPGLKPLIVRVERDEKFLLCLKSELESFCKELENVVEKIK